MSCATLLIAAAYWWLGAASSHAQASPNGGQIQTLTALLELDLDSDGDGRTGAAEDADGDRVFGTLTAIPGFDQPTGIVAARSTYNHVTIVSSGVIRQSVRRTPHLSLPEFTLEAAPGVTAIFDPADLDPAPPSPVVVASSYVTLRNLAFRNTSHVISAESGSRFLIEDCRFEDIGRGFAIVAKSGSQVVVRNAVITRCGDPQNGEGGGIRVERGANVVVVKSTITGNYGTGVASDDRSLRLLDTVVTFNRRNGPR